MVPTQAQRILMKIWYGVVNCALLAWLISFKSNLTYIYVCVFTTNISILRDATLHQSNVIRYDNKNKNMNKLVIEQRYEYYDIYDHPTHQNTVVSLLKNILHLIENITTSFHQDKEETDAKWGSSMYYNHSCVVRMRLDHHYPNFYAVNEMKYEGSMAQEKIYGAF